MPSKSNTVREMWSEFEEMVLVDDGISTRSASKMAFYAGAGAVLANIKRLAEDNTDDDVAREQLALWFDECHRFITGDGTVGSGPADGQRPN